MNKCLFFLFVFFGLAAGAFAADNPASPVGYWQTIDDVTGKPKAIVQLWESKQHLFGRIVKFYPSPGHDENEICTECTDARHNKPIMGMMFLENLVQNPNDKNLWENGSILDPKNGKIYHSQIRLFDHGQKLNVRGYIGMPLFGRTQTWMHLSPEH